MNKYLVHLYGWENPRLYSADSDLNKEDEIIVKGEFGNDLGIVVSDKLDCKEEPAQSILRKATDRDIETHKKNQEKKEDIKKECRKEVKREGLEMKLVDVEISLDGGSVIVIFSAEERIDFRDLVKNLSRILHRSVRMHQIGSRDEARKLGGCGVCGRELCCVKLLKELPSISIETAKAQQIAHRGSERISGQCGRLLCCLSYEYKQYQELLEGMPELNSTVKTDKGKGEVVELNALKQEIKVRLEDGTIETISKEDL